MADKYILVGVISILVLLIAGNALLGFNKENKGREIAVEFKLNNKHFQASANRGTALFSATGATLVFSNKNSAKSETITCNLKCEQ